MNKKAILSTFGIVVLGALGSALWDGAKPLLLSLASILANFTTLGLESLRDDLYAHAARSLGRPTGIGVSMQALAAFLTALLAALFYVLSLSSEPRVSRYARAFTNLLLVCAVALWVQSIRGGYAVQLAHHYEILEVLAAPHISEAERKQALASFALVRSKVEYLKVTESLSSAISAAGGKPPPFP